MAAAPDNSSGQSRLRSVRMRNTAIHSDSQEQRFFVTSLLAARHGGR